MRRFPAILAALFLLLAAPALAELDFRWDPLPELPAPRSNGALVALDGNLYFLGGNGPEGPSAACWRLGPGGAWSAIADLPLPRATHGAAVAGGRIFVVGGLGEDGQPLDRVDLYDPATGRWHSGPALTRPRSRLALVSLRGALVAAGGAEPGVPASRRVEILEPGATSWSKGPSLPLGLNRLGAAALDGTLVVAGGETRQGEASARVFRLQVASPGGGRTPCWSAGWQEAPPLRQARKNFAMATLGRRIVVAGGWVRPGLFLASVEEGDGLGGWSELPPLSRARDGLRAACLDGRILLAGGHDRVPRAEVGQGAWHTPKSAWRVDRRLGFHLAWHDERERSGTPARPLLSEPWKADITNIAMTGLRDLGFPIRHPAPEGLNFYLKFFECPAGVDPLVSAGRALSPLLVPQMAGSSQIQEVLAQPGGVVIKKAVVAPAGDPFSPEHPFPPCLVPTGAGAQDEFDQRTPFTSLYVQGDGTSSRTLAGTPAQGSADGVLAFHTELLELLAATWTEVEGPDPSRFRTFQDRSQPGRTVLVRVPLAPLVFQDYRSLPMPEDPDRVFLTGLLLVYRDVYAGEPGPATLLDSRVLEVGSVVRL